MTREMVRAWIEDDGLRVCRDVHDANGYPQPQHLVEIGRGWRGLIWENHKEGAKVPTVSETTCCEFL